MILYIDSQINQNYRSLQCGGGGRGDPDFSGLSEHPEIVSVYRRPDHPEPQELPAGGGRLCPDFSEPSRLCESPDNQVESRLLDTSEMRPVQQSRTMPKK